MFKHKKPLISMVLMNKMLYEMHWKVCNGVLKVLQDPKKYTYIIYRVEWSIPYGWSVSAGLSSGLVLGW